MNWVLFWVLFVIITFNLFGIGLFHYTWKKERKEGSWKCWEFWGQTIYYLFFGTTYCIARLIEAIRANKEKKERE